MVAEVVILVYNYYTFNYIRTFMAKMKKLFCLLTVAMMAVTACFGLCACMGYRTVAEYEDADKYLAGPQTYDVADLDELYIDWPAGQVVLVEDPNATSVMVAEENNLSEKKKVHSYLKDGVLNVKFWQSGLRSVAKETDKVLTITYRSVRNLSVQSSSATVRAATLDVERVTFEMTSGDVEIGNVTCNTIVCEMTSGDMDFKEIVCDKFTCKMTSGELNVKQIAAESSVEFSMSSGEAKFSEILAKNTSVAQTSGNITISAADVEAFSSRSTSGSLNASFTHADKIDVVLTSGDAEIGIPASGATVAVAGGKPKSDLAYSVKSGKYIFGDGSCEVAIEMTSGSVRIK